MYKKITHSITEEHFEHPMAAEIKSYVEHCGTATMAFHSTGTHRSTALGATAANVGLDAYKLWSDLANTNKSIVSASVNNPSQISFLQSKAMANINAIGAYCNHQYGVAAGNAVIKTLYDFELALIHMIEVAARGQDTTEAKAAVDKHIAEIGTLLSGANPTHWPKATIISAFEQYAAQILLAVPAESKKQWDTVNTISHNIDALFSTIAAVFASGFTGNF